jgi:hypothetical protein
VEERCPLRTNVTFVQVRLANCCEDVRHLSFPSATLACAVFLWVLPPECHWIFIRILSLIVGVLIVLLRNMHRRIPPSTA